MGSGGCGPPQEAALAAHPGATDDAVAKSGRVSSASSEQKGDASAAPLALVPAPHAGAAGADEAYGAFLACGAAAPVRRSGEAVGWTGLKAGGHDDEGGIDGTAGSGMTPPRFANMARADTFGRLSLLRPMSRTVTPTPSLLARSISCAKGSSGH